jgi:hyperosmotically inducible protein
MRTLLRLVLVLVLVVVAAVLVMNYLPGARSGPDGSTGTSGVNTERAREAGAKVGETVAVAGQRLKEEAAEASITGKIKAKMALDDAIKARAIDVSTEGSVVTLSGTVETAAERDRSVRLARETEGVTSVVDRLAGPRP